MPDPGKRSSEDDNGTLFYFLTVALAVLMFLGMLVYASRDLWQ